MNGVAHTDRHLPMAGGYNFRDLGGYPTTDGRVVKQKKIIRSDDMFHLTADDLASLSSLPLVTVVDFRAKEEAAQAPDKLPETVRHHYSYPIVPGNIDMSMDFFSLDAEEAAQLMQGVYRELVASPESIKQYKAYFHLLQGEENTSLLFHCSAGKDRTGIAAALTLFALGVDEETIVQDYLLSNVYLADKYRKYTDPYPGLKPFFEVNPAYFQSSIQWIKTQHECVENYLEHVLDVNIEKLRNIYLCNNEK